MKEKILGIIFIDIIIYAVSFVFVFVGYNLLLPQVFDFIQKLSLSKIFMLTVAMDFISMPIRLEIEFYIDRKINRKED